ncbi:MAG TPA: zinc dependent phospholipase C family protein [Methylomusa anaerophila]|uniref:Phospholipase C/D domain-containing protein n=1 Tax=Methylomusa anaerophila TaxID=1930071 RepID=A0A348AJR6_9FIRM|nr:zinc dependent phospholipase C family protein [Methylomusa anaerophila]BBB91314.1 hypothetical protein MAMMFC1_01992 [Methylomusa anaerophila]HML90511.1 zinc dependent phospholipase C family protein [Methylomusa anaerophila]
MFTVHHGFWIYFFTRNHPRVWHFVFGSMFPDYVYVILIAMVMVQGLLNWHELISLTPEMLMGLVALHPWAARIDLIGHSVVIWLIVMIACLLLPGIKQFKAFVVGWGSHLFIDAITHGAYSNFFLYPLSHLTVESPVSYWEPDHWVHEYKLVNTSLMAIAMAYLIFEWWQKRKKRGKIKK